jgi:hypothetical protein
VKDNAIGARPWPRSFLTRVALLNLADSWLARRFARTVAPRNPPAELRPGDLADPRPTAILSRIEAHEPDAAWAMYRHLDGRTQQYIAEHVSEKRWSELLLREIEDRVLRDTTPPQRSHGDAIAEEVCDGLNRHVRNQAVGETPPANWLAYELGHRKFRVSPDRAIAREERPDGSWPLVVTEYVLMHARRSPTPESRAWVQRLVANLKPPVT